MNVFSMRMFNVPDKLYSLIQPLVSNHKTPKGSGIMSGVLTDIFYVVEQNMILLSSC